MTEYSIPSTSLLGIEHPCRVERTAAGIKTLGGTRCLGEAVAKASTGARTELRLRPDDPLGAPICSENMETSDLLLKVTVPKLIRRPKRPLAQQNGGTRLPNQLRHDPDEPPLSDSKRLLRAMKDNPGDCDFQFVGRVDRTHRFRCLPEHQLSAPTNEFSGVFGRTAAPMDWDVLKHYNSWNAGRRRGDTEVLPGPRMSLLSVPWNYNFQANHMTRRPANESGKPGAPNAGPVAKIYTPRLGFDIGQVPTAPPAATPKLDDLDPQMREMIRAVTAAFEERPIWTRRALENHIDRPEWRQLFKHSYQYCSYMFRSGPWRDCAVRLGVDPRKDPSYRVYQTMLFQLEKPEGQPGVDAEGNDPAPQPPAEGGTVEKPPPRRSHKFDGTGVTVDGRVRQVCDISEPTIRALFLTPSLRRTCDIRGDGWFHNGTMAKARVLMKAMMQALLHGGPGLDPVAVASVAGMPDVLDPDARAPKLTRSESRLFGELASAVKGMASAPERLAAPMDGRGQGAGGGMVEDDGVEDDYELEEDEVEDDDGLGGMEEDYGGGGVEDEYDGIPIDPRLRQIMGGVRMNEALDDASEGDVEMGEGDEAGEEEVDVDGSGNEEEDVESERSFDE